MILTDWIKEASEPLATVEGQVLPSKVARAMAREPWKRVLPAGVLQEQRGVGGRDVHVRCNV